PTSRREKSPKCARRLRRRTHNKKSTRSFCGVPWVSPSLPLSQASFIPFSRRRKSLTFQGTFEEKGGWVIFDPSSLASLGLRATARRPSNQPANKEARRWPLPPSAASLQSRPRPLVPSFAKGSFDHSGPKARQSPASSTLPF